MGGRTRRACVRRLGCMMCGRESMSEKIMMAHMGMHVYCVVPMQETWGGGLGVESRCQKDRWGERCQMNGDYIREGAAVKDDGICMI